MTIYIEKERKLFRTISKEHVDPSTLSFKKNIFTESMKSKDEKLSVESHSKDEYHY